jgi:hypothetical protein
LKKCAATWDKVFVVPGPSEIKSVAEGCNESPLPFSEQTERLRDLCNGVKHLNGSNVVTFMDQTEYYYSDMNIVILAAGGWSDCRAVDTFPLESEEANTIWVADINGLRHIEPGDFKKWHMDDIEWLNERLSWWQIHRPFVRVLILTHSLCNGQLLNRELPKEVYKRIYIDIMPFDTTRQTIAHKNIHAWLCGATGSCASGFVGIMRGGVFSSVNALYATPDMKYKNPSFISDRKIEIKYSEEVESLRKADTSIKLQ